jgi:nicotinate-nucleotide pyrophosphorylase (carboxylating)
MKMPSQVRRAISLAIEEDLGTGDVTSELVIPEGKRSKAKIVAKEGFIVAGLPFAAEVFAQMDTDVKFKSLVKNGAKVNKGDVLAEVSGLTRSLLAGERVALNILQHLSGVATLTSFFVQRIKGTKARIVDTRKTLPNMRYMQKYAVRVGGGANHRFALYDGILIKDNHIKAAGGIKKAVSFAKSGMHLLKVEVEAGSVREFKEALDAGADVIMLDNMSTRDMAECVRLNKGRAVLEASGNVTLDNVRAIAQTGVDLISTGTITHSVMAVDISMKVE